MTPTKKGTRQHRAVPSYQMHPADFAILGALPKEGTMAGLHTVGVTIKGMVRGELGTKGGLTSPQINARLRTLKARGYIVDVLVMPVSEGRGWQITKKGEEALREWKEQQ